MNRQVREISPRSTPPQVDFDRLIAEGYKRKYERPQKTPENSPDRRLLIFRDAIREHGLDAEGRKEELEEVTALLKEMWVAFDDPEDVKNGIIEALEIIEERKNGLK